MAYYTGHGDRAVTPGTTKIELKFIVLDILIPSNRMLYPDVSWIHHNSLKRDPLFGKNLPTSEWPLREQLQAFQPHTEFCEP